MSVVPDIVIWVSSKTLSDGSEVYNIQLLSEKIPAITGGDATDLAQKIADAINAHSNVTAGVVED